MTKDNAAVSGETNASVLSERLRVSAILESPEGKRNPELANELALRSALDVETARAILSKAPASNPYLAAMAKEGPVSVDAATADFSNDPKAARMREIAASAKAFNEAMGYTRDASEG